METKTKTYELIETIMSSEHQEIGNGAGKMLRAWTPCERQLAKYAAELRAENARLDAALVNATDALTDATKFNEATAAELRITQRENARLRQELDEARKCRDLLERIYVNANSDDTGERLTYYFDPEELLEIEAALDR